MSKKTVFISDIHLDESRPELTRLFLQVLHSQRPEEIDALYILGDLFESWTGDEDQALHTEVVQALARVTQKGLPVYFLHGNRDFLIGESFLKNTGCQLLAEETKVQLYGEPVLLVHGDTLCTNDIAYLKARKFLRSKALQTLFLLLPWWVRKKIARGIRKKSRKHTAMTESKIMDVVPSAVEETMAHHQVRHLIHGHTHRPGIHPLYIEARPGSRIVLGAWHEGGNLLVWQDTGDKELVDIIFPPAP